MTAPGPEAFCELHEAVLRTIGDLHMEVIECIEEGDTAMGHVRITGIYNKTGDKLDYLFSFTLRWRDGKLTGGRDVVDYISFMVQIGQLEADAVQRLFA